MTAGGRVVDVVAAQAEDPATGRWPGSCGCARTARGSSSIRGAGRGIDPLLGDLLHLPVERRGDLVAAGVDLRAVGRACRGRGSRPSCAADLPHELGRLPGRPTPAARGRPARAWPRRTRRRCASCRSACCGSSSGRGRGCGGWTISEFVSGTMSSKCGAVLVVGDGRSLQTSSAFFTRSNFVGDCGMAARIANWASVRSLSDLPK